MHLLSGEWTLSVCGDCGPTDRVGAWLGLAYVVGARAAAAVSLLGLQPVPSEGAPNARALEAVVVAARPSQLLRLTACGPGSNQVDMPLIQLGYGALERADCN